MVVLPRIDSTRDLYRVLRNSGVQLQASLLNNPFSLPPKKSPIIKIRGYAGTELTAFIVQKAAFFGVLEWVPNAWVEDVQRSMVRDMLTIEDELG